MRITVDTNILVRAMVEDDLKQAKAAQAELETAEVVALALPALCELGWVLSRGYKMPGPTIAAAIRELTNGANVAVDHAAVAAGLAMLDAGGDFADAVIAHEGAKLGGSTFVSFNRKAIRLSKGKARLPAV